MHPPLRHRSVELPHLVFKTVMAHKESPQVWGKDTLTGETNIMSFEDGLPAP